MGKVFHNFFADWGNNKLFGRIFTYAKGSIGCVRALSKKNDVDWNCGGSLGENYSIAFTWIENIHNGDFRMLQVLKDIPGINWNQRRTKDDHTPFSLALATNREKALLMYIMLRGINSP